MEACWKVLDQPFHKDQEPHAQDQGVCVCVFVCLCVDCCTYPSEQLAVHLLVEIFLPYSRRIVATFLQTLDSSFTGAVDSAIFHRISAMSQSAVGSALGWSQCAAERVVLIFSLLSERVVLLYLKPRVVIPQR